MSYRRKAELSSYRMVAGGGAYTATMAVFGYLLLRDRSGHWADMDGDKLNWDVSFRIVYR